MKLTFTQMCMHLLMVLTITLCINVRLKAQASLNLNIGNDTILPLKQSGPTTIHLNATYTGNPVSLIWTQLSGTTVSIPTPDQSSIILTNFQEGHYSFKCEATGDQSNDSDTINIRVVNYQNKNAAPCRTGPPVVWTLSATNTTDLYRPYLKKSGFDIRGGDTVKINANPNNGGVYNRIYLGEFGGSDGCPVVVVPNNQVVKIGGASARWFLGTNTGIADSNFVNHVVIDGTYLRDKTGDQYGFQSTGTGFGMGTRLITDLEIKGCLFKDNSLAIQIKILSDSLYPWTVYDNFTIKNIKIHDNYFTNMVGSEGLYIGSTDPSGATQAGNHGPVPRLDSVFIYNNFFNGTAWDPIQTSAARYTEIHDNIVMNGSVINQSSQNWGILMGANCTGKIYNNVMYNGKGGTVGTLGYGPTEIYYNFIDSTQGGSGTSDGIYADMKNGRIAEASIPGMFPPLQLTIRDNIVSRFERNAIFHANNEHTSLPGSISNNYVVDPTRSLSQLIRSNAGDVISNNTLVKSFPVTIREVGSPATGPLVQVTQGAESATFSRSKDIIDWLYSRLTGAPPPNQPPSAEAGSNISVTLPLNTVSLNGIGTDTDGTIVSYSWSKVSGPAQFVIQNDATAQTTVNALVQGTYRFRLFVTDNKGASDADTVTVTVNAVTPPPVNQPPVASAGNDITITLPVNSASLTGSGTDSDGSVASYSWSKIAGPSQFVISNAGTAQTTVSSLVQGTYQFRLLVTDNNGATDSDTVMVTVNAVSTPPPVNQPPVANAGNNITITLPVNTATLSGSATDLDGSVISYSWSKIAGPSQFVMASSNAATTSVNSLVQGTYQFRLVATDDDGATDSDTVMVTVNAVSPPPPANQAPIANAGSDFTLILPVNTAYLSGSGTDNDGSIVSYSWTKISGPLFCTIASPSASQTQVIFTLPGIYEFRLRVTDNGGAVSYDNVTVEVKENIRPSANAGQDLEIEYPTDTIQLQGTGTDADGFIAEVEWRLINGPAQIVIKNPKALQTLVSDLTIGTYIFELQITDNNGATGKDTMELTVMRIPISKTSIYPNPTTTTLNIRIDANTHSNLTLLVIYDVSGKIIYSEQFMRNELTMIKQINVEHLIPGTYMAQIGADINQKQTLKFIKQ